MRDNCATVHLLISTIPNSSEGKNLVGKSKTHDLIVNVSTLLKSRNDDAFPELWTRGFNESQNEEFYNRSIGIS